MQVFQQKNKENHVPFLNGNSQKTSAPTAQFKDNRSEATSQLKIQKIANTTVQRKANKTGIPDQLKSGIENLSGIDMSDVKVHYNSPQPAQLQAHAYAQGNQIHLASGQEKHLPHEAWHVVQQKQGRVSPTKQLKGKVSINDDSGLEKEADVMGAKALQMRTHKIGRNVSKTWSTTQLRTENNVLSTYQPPIQLKTYAQLEHVQRSQVDAIGENIFHKKAPDFEQKTAQVAAGDNRGDVGLNALLTLWLAAGGIGPAGIQLVTHRLQHGTRAEKFSVAADASNIGAIAPAINPYVNATQQETVRSSFDHRAMVGGQINPNMGVPVPGSNLVMNNYEDGKLRPDSAHAKSTRENKITVGTGGSNAIHNIYNLAVTTLALPAGSAGGVKIAVIGNYVPLGHSLPEVLKSYDPALNATTGRTIYHHIDPLKESNIGLLYPDFFIRPRFKITLAKAFYPDAASNDRADAYNEMPGDVRGWVQGWVGNNNLKTVQDTVNLNALTALGIPKILIETLSTAQIASVTTFMGVVYSGPSRLALDAAVGAKSGALIAAIKREGDNPGGHAESTRIASVAATLNAGFTTGVGMEAGHGYTPIEIAGMAGVHAINQVPFGQYDANVDLNAQNFNAVTAAGEASKGLSIQDYTRTNFSRYTTLTSRPEAPITAPGAPARAQTLIEKQQNTVRLRALVSGLAALPAYRGAVFTGRPTNVINTEQHAQQYEHAYPPGKVYTPGVPFSAAKNTHLSSWFQDAVRPHLGLVIDDTRTGKDIQNISSMASEREVLFPPSARFIVTRTQRLLDPDPAHPGQFSSGLLLVLMKEVVDTATVAETATFENEADEAIEHELDGRRFIDKPHYDRKERTHAREEKIRLHGATQDTLEAPEYSFSPEEFEDWKRGAAYLSGTMAAGNLTEARIQQLHTLAGAHVDVNAGTYRTAGVMAGGRGPRRWWNVLTPAQYAAVHANPDLIDSEITAARIDQLAGYWGYNTAVPREERFSNAEITWARQQFAAHNHIVHINYPGHATVPAKMAAYVIWFNAQVLAVTAAVNANPLLYSVADLNAIYTLAAQAQLKYVSIHPFQDGNGRTSRFLMDLVALKFNMKFAILANPGSDYYNTDAQWATQIQQGDQYHTDMRTKYGR